MQHTTLSFSAAQADLFNRILNSNTSFYISQARCCCCCC